VPAIQTTNESVIILPCNIHTQLSVAEGSLCAGYKYVTPEHMFSKNLVKGGGGVHNFLKFIS